MAQESWAKLRARGYKRCIGTLRQSRAGDEKSRRLMAKKGGRCRHHVPPEEIAKRGLPLCGNHFRLFEEDVERDLQVRASLRAKYDPGPLPLEGDE